MKAVLLKTAAKEQNYEIVSVNQIYMHLMNSYITRKHSK
jgi:hypothetical protein